MANKRQTMIKNHQDAIWKINAIKEALSKVIMLHDPRDYGEGGALICAACGTSYPCLTIKAIRKGMATYGN